MNLTFRRVIAFIIDYFICYEISRYANAYFYGTRPDFRAALILFLTFFLLLLLKDFAIGGRSIGKRIMKLKIVSADGGKVRVWQPLLRNVTLIISPVEIILVLMGGRRLGDRLAKTAVEENSKPDERKVQTP